MQTTEQIRRQIRKQRRALSIREQRQAGTAIVNKLRKHPPFLKAQHIGLYLSAFGEVPTDNIAKLCIELKKTIYLPQIRPFDMKLVWVRCSYHQWRNRRFAAHIHGMKEPCQHRGVSVQKLDVLIMPLIAFDSARNRIGMGGGYYDRTLWKKNRSYRLGIAYNFQQITKIGTRLWDQALDDVITPTRLNVSITDSGESLPNV